MKRFGAIALVGGLLMGAASTASALQTQTPRSGRVHGERVDANDSAQKRALREEIRAKQAEYRELRRANDPRAEQAAQDVRALKAEWTRLYGDDEDVRTREQRGQGKKLGHAKHKREHRNGKHNH